MAGILGLVLAVVVAREEALCSLIQSRGARPLNAIELSLRATTDSLLEIGGTAAAISETGHRQRQPRDVEPVYAQVFQVDRIDGDREAFRSREFRRVAVLWWRLGMHCQRVSPKPAVRSDVRELFLPALQMARRDSLNETFGAFVADLRPESQWIGGMPTFDVTDGGWTYSPSERAPVNLPPAQGTVTISEYRDLFAHLPIIGASYNNWQLSWRALLRWGDADARRWTLYPAGSLLCNAAASLGDSTLARERCQ